MTPGLDTAFFALIVDEGLNATLHLNLWALLLLLALCVLVVVVYRWVWKRSLPPLEIDTAEFGLGDSKIVMRPSTADRTVAYKIWVELSTRKIGLPIDPEHDVIEEIYDSWYTFFSVTRELIKEVPVGRARKDSTQKIINLSIEVLNEALRPHLTRWQARFRRWYARAASADPSADLYPQDIQKQFPDIELLMEDMLAVNAHLIAYRRAMRALVDGG